MNGDISMHLSHMRDMERGLLLWLKGSYQYRISEVFSGTICLLLDELFNLSNYQLILVYKYFYYALYMGVVLLISPVWKKIFNYDTDGVMYRMSNVAILLILMGFPLSCLLLKVCNYDAGCVLFGIAGLSFVILADKLSNAKNSVCRCAYIQIF